MAIRSNSISISIEESREPQISTEIEVQLKRLEEHQVHWVTKVLTIVIPFFGWILGGCYWNVQSQLYGASCSKLTPV